MKKKLLILCMLILSIGILSTKTFAQVVTGGSSEGYGIPVDGGISTPIVINPPSYVSYCKRNNGNGTSIGLADARLNFSDKKFHPVTLLEIQYLDGTNLPKGAAVMDMSGVFQRGCLSYALFFNVPPNKKLLFHFGTLNGDFWIPEL